MQQFFNNHILKSEQAEYRKEGIFWVPIDIPDNSDCISLIAGKPSGLICLLDSACIMPKGNAETFVNNIFTVQGKHARLTTHNAPVPEKAKVQRKKASNTAAQQKRKQFPPNFMGFLLHHYGKQGGLGIGDWRLEIGRLAHVAPKLTLALLHPFSW